MSISKEKNNGERYKVQVTLNRRTFYMGYYNTYEEAVAANDAAVEARNKGMMALVNHHAKHSKSMIASRCRGVDSNPLPMPVPVPVPVPSSKPSLIEQKKAHVLGVVSRWQYVNKQQLAKHIEASYLQIDNLDLDNLIAQLIEESKVFKQGNQYYVKK